MRSLRMIPLTRLCSLLCIALALVFAGSSLASAVDHIQHTPGATAEHEHLLFSEISAEDAHDQDHHASDHQESDQGDEDPSDQMAGGHHHHGDSGAGLIVLVAVDSSATAPSADNPGFVPDRPAIGIRIPGPERPPKISMIRA